jgi:uncharacterized protein (UPF0297 family)
MKKIQKYDNFVNEKVNYPDITMRELSMEVKQKVQQAYNSIKRAGRYTVNAIVDYLVDNPYKIEEIFDEMKQSKTFQKSKARKEMRDNGFDV